MALISVLFFLSGFAALVYELLWLRHLGFIFGNTVYAATTVLTAYMAGLAAGAHLFGRWVERARRPVAWFGLLQLAICVYALAMPILFLWTRGIYRAAYQNVSDSMLFLTPLRFVLGFVILLLPTLAMGASLPVLAHGLLRREEKFGVRLGWLYGINTLGAVAGTLATGFLLIPSLGLTGTNWTAVTVNAAVGLAALALARSMPALEPARGGAADVRDDGLTPEAWRALAVVAYSGFLALAFEVIWFRTLILVFGSTTHSFGVMLSVFLAGIALGSMALSPILDRTRQVAALLALALIGIGGATIWSMYQFNGKPEFLLRYLVDHGFTWSVMTRARFLIALSFLLVPTILFGFVFTAVTRWVRSQGGSPSRSVGAVYAANTVGAVAGSLCGGFVLLPWLGMERSLFVLSFGAVAGGLLLAASGGIPRLGRILLFLAGVAVLAAALVRPPQWDRRLLASGAYFSPWNYVENGELRFREQILGERLLFCGEGVTATASTTKGEDEQMYMSVDGKVEADTGARGMVVQRMIGHLPMLFHPDPRCVMNLGLGAGVTFGSLGCYPVDHLEVVEIEPIVTNAAAIWGRYNHFVMDHPGRIVTINDGRNHLLCTTNLYDVITSDPFEPVVGGSANLFTVEHFRQARERLAPGGIMCQWVPMYELSRQDYLTILRSFVHVFTNSTLFFTGTDSLMLGFRDGTSLDPAVVRAKFEIPAVRESLAEIGIERPELILGMFVADMAKGEGFVGPGPLNTDEHPVIEFSAPKSALHFTPYRNQQVMLDNFTAIPELMMAGVAEPERQGVLQDHAALKLTLEASLLQADGDMQGCYEKLVQARAMSPANPVIRNELVNLRATLAAGMMKAGDSAQALEQYQLVLQDQPDHFWAIQNLVFLAMVAGNEEFAGDILRQGLQYYPESPLMISLRGKFRASTGDVMGGWMDMEKAVEMWPDNPRLWTEFGNLALAFGEHEAAEKFLGEAERLRKDPW